MPLERFKHLLIPDPPREQPFTSVQSGGDSETKLPVRDREKHAEMLRIQFDAAWNASSNRNVAAHSTRKGLYLEFVSTPDFDLALRSLEDMRKDIRLMNVRTVEGIQGRQTLATVYIPTAARSHFLKKFEDYAKLITKWGRPKNESSLARLEEIKEALLEDFWTDRQEALPGDTQSWVEVWLHGDGDVVHTFRARLQLLGIREHPQQPILTFPERTILLVLANRTELSSILIACDSVAELRAAREVPSYFLELQNREQAEWVRDLANRIRIQSDSVSICILDQGVNRQHPLLEPALSRNDVHTYDEAWGTADDAGHGTLMAGLALFGDLQRALESKSTLDLSHCLESAKILPPPPEENPVHLWGHVTSQALSRAQIQAPERKRIMCLAVAAQQTRDGGHPTSWSAELDNISIGATGGREQLIVVCAGNVNENWGSYVSENVTSEIHDPGQSWNALTVGAFTEKPGANSSIRSGFKPIAPIGGLSPFSTTSYTWEHESWPLKPEIVFEGGNATIDDLGTIDDPEDLKLLSTCHNFTSSHFWPFGGTSAATAQAAWFAAQIQVTYPELWPETVRGLLVHSARWTQTMFDQFVSPEGKTGYRQLLRTCGYGVPDLLTALSAPRNCLNLIAERTLQPFVIRENKSRATNVMHLYELPWPKDELLKLGECPVQMRVTLSYFVEPGPGEVGWGDRYRYASHGFRFELNAVGETETEFVKRINKQARLEDDDIPDTQAPNEHWLLGQQRNVGSIHSDVWSGRAADLASSNLIAVRPVVGWWRERYHLGKVENVARYSLLVSIETPIQTVDIYTPVAAKVGVPTPVAIEIPVF